MVVIDDPADTYGGKVAAPVFSEVMSTALDRMQIPSETTTAATTPQFDLAQEVARGRRQSCSVPHGEQMQRIIAGREAARIVAEAPSTTTTTSTQAGAKTRHTIGTGASTTRTPSPQTTAESGASSTRASSTTDASRPTTTTRPRPTPTTSRSTRTTGGSPPTSSG